MENIDDSEAFGDALPTIGKSRFELEQHPRMQRMTDSSRAKSFTFDNRA